MHGGCLEGEDKKRTVSQTRTYSHTLIATRIGPNEYLDDKPVLGAPDRKRRARVGGAKCGDCLGKENNNNSVTGG